MSEKIIFNEEYIQNFLDFQKVANVDMLAEYWEYYKEKFPFNHNLSILKEETQSRIVALYELILELFKSEEISKEEMFTLIGLCFKINN